MANEIEAKLKVADLAAVRDRLRAAGAQRVKAELETNSFFDSTDQMLRKSDCGLRIRAATNESDEHRCVITFKGPHQAGKFKTREEIEFTADNPDSVRAIFERLGYQLALSFQKRRETWDLKSCEVVLDELPHLGTFVEIEGVSEEAISEVQRILKLESSTPIQNGYADMIAKYLDQNQIKDRVVKF